MGEGVLRGRASPPGSEGAGAGVDLAAQEVGGCRPAACRPSRGPACGRGGVSIEPGAPKGARRVLLTVGFRGAASKASVGGWAEKAPGQLRCEPGPRFWVGVGGLGAGSGGSAQRPSEKKVVSTWKSEVVN